MVWPFGSKSKLDLNDHDVLFAELQRMFVYYVQQKKHALYEQYDKLDADEIQKLIDRMKKAYDTKVTTGEQLVKSVTKLHGKVPAKFTIPDAIGTMTKDEVIKQILDLMAEYGQPQQQEKVAETAAKFRTKNCKPYEGLLENVRQRLEMKADEMRRVAAEQEEAELARSHQEASVQQVLQEHTPQDYGARTPEGPGPQDTSLVPVSENAESQGSPNSKIGFASPEAEPDRLLSPPHHGRRASVSRKSPRGSSFTEAIPPSPVTSDSRPQPFPPTSTRRHRTPSVVSSAQGDGDSSTMNDPIRSRLASSVNKGTRKIQGKKNTVTALHQHYEDKQRQQQEDYASLYDEVQNLKRTIDDQVTTHKSLIGLHQDQQDFLQKYLLTQERENGAMAAEAHVLRMQYNAALDQWNASRTLGKNIGLSGSPMHVPQRSPERCRGIGIWLEGLGLPEYVDIFVFNEIDFSSVTLLTEDDLIRMGVQALGPRKTIVRAIAELARQQLEESPRAKSRARVAQSMGYTGNLPDTTSPQHGGTVVAPAVSPSQWRAHVDTTSSRVYYYNGGTGESKWELPDTSQTPLDALADLL